MKILVIGNGGREHAICWKLSLNDGVEKIYCATGNGGTALTSKCENIGVSKIDDILNFAKEKNVDLTIVGSEELLVEGIVDKFKENGLKIFGADKKSALLEGSKAFAKEFMKKYGVRTAKYEIFDNHTKAKEYLKACEHPVVVKASGLAAGKGAIICNTLDESLKAIDDIMVDKIFAQAGDKVVIEEYLQGVEASILSITDSNVIKDFISAKDHKKIGENESGLNTGGMGAIAPNPYVSDEVYQDFYKNILLPTLKGIKEENMDFAGFIFFGLMITKKGVYLLEYNMRLGDPETQVVLPLLESDFLEILNCAMEKNLENCEIKWKNKSACCVVGVSKGYPLKYEKGFEIKGLENIKNHYFIAGANLKDKLVTSGGRVINIVSVANTLDEAIRNSYEDIEKVDFENIYYRKDIGKI